MGARTKRPRCITCLTPAKALFKKSDGDFIKLLECPSCGQTVDRYVECEKSIIFMDMLLQDIAVYRHILFNADNFEPQFYVKLAVSLLLSEGYVRWSTLTHTFAPAAGIKDNEVYLYIMCLLTAVEFGIFGAIILLYSWIKFHDRIELSSLYNGLLLGQYGRLANVAAIIWYQSPSLIFQSLVLVFIIISTIQSTRGAINTGRCESSFLVITATAISTSSSYIFQLYLIDMYKKYSL
ncbi:protein ARV1-like isoform X1 [Portunus trituberculatus]|uniref:protein ARV1-like isoform X1 n=2 Tax=Portunus trituberculatus TaxID=210409 RepID=UPI001E1D114C|nr:protein ARV1-like isoform X1 [Portunus trituberculatus]